MSTTTPTTDSLNSTDFETNKIPSTINILTILTFIGSGISLLMSLISPWFTKFMLNIMDKAVNNGTEYTTEKLEEMAKGRRALEMMQANLYPLMIVGIIAGVLCIVGAMQMRKLKKDGFWLYTGGELLPLIAGFVLMGLSQFTGISSYIFGIGLPLLFIVLYAMQRKHMVN